jgi:hypothetical protein
MKFIVKPQTNEMKRGKVHTRCALCSENPRFCW